MEHLEERLNPAVISWDVDADGYWDEALNWSTDTVPGPDDDVVIDIAAGDFVVTIRSGDQAVKSLLSQEAVALTGGSLALAAASRFDGALTLSGGVLGGAGNVTVAGILSWTAGDIIGSGDVTAESAVSLSGDEIRNLVGRTFLNTATATLTGAGSLRLWESAVITNQTGGTFDFQGDGDLQGASGENTFNNAGLVVKSARSLDPFGFSGVSGALSFHNAGTVNVRAGSLRLLSRGNHGGNFNVADGASLSFGGETHDLGPTSSIIGAGGVAFGTAGFGVPIVTVNMAGRYDIAGFTAATNALVHFNAAAAVQSVGAVSIGSFGTLDFNSGETITAPSLQLSGLNSAVLTGSDNITVTDSLTWTAGTMSGAGQTISQGAFSLDSPEPKFLVGRRFINTGNATVLGSGPLHIRNNAVFDNRPGAIFDMRTQVATARLEDTTGTGQFHNFGSFLQSSGTSTVGVTFRNLGNVAAASTLDFDTSLTTDDLGWLGSDSPTEVRISGNLTGTSSNGDLYAPFGTLRMDGAGTPANPQLLEVMGRDLGSTATGFYRNFAYGTVALANNTYVRLVDNADNAAGTGTEALYVDHLVVPAGTALDLNQIPVYARALQVAGQIIGTVVEVGDGGPIVLNAPTPGAIAALNEVDEWTFFGRAGQSVSVVVNPGSGPPPTPLAPVLNYARVTLVSPQGQDLATASSNSAGEVATLPGVALTSDGVYTVRVDVPPAQAGSQGNYVLAIWDATTDVAELTLNTQTTGRLETPQSVDRWTFAGFANQQIRFDWLNSAANTIRFKLTGPSNWTGFDGLSGDSGPITLPASGTYTLEAFNVGGSGGAYSFRVLVTSVTNLGLSVPFLGTFTGTGHSQLFKVTLAEDNPLLVTLDLDNDNARSEVYVRKGSPPTRRDYEYRGDRPGADHFVAIPLATPGDWYVLVYGEAIPAASPFTLQVDSRSLILERVAPNRAGTNTIATVTLHGAGFLPGATVELVAGGGGTFAAQSVEIDGFDQLTAEFELSSVPAGTYDVRVRAPGGDESTLAGTFEVVAGGEARLETRIIVPAVLGVVGPATLFVEYTNVGTAAMSAPILTLTSPDRPLLTLDASRLVEAVWTSAVPDGFSNSVQIYACGATPGLLLPGESLRVPVYYAGLRTRNTSDPWIDFEVRTHEADNPAPIDWPSLKSTLKPTWMAADAWDAVFANLVAQIGPTWGDYVRMLSDNANYLRRLGLHITDVSQLCGFEVQQAAGLSLFSNLASAVDAFLPGTGLPLAFGRSFGNTITERYRIGPFGRGWTASWDIALEQLPDGTVIVHESADAQRRFQPDFRLTGVYFSQPGDAAKLRGLGGGVFELTEADGLVTRFRIDGKIDYVQDPNGNRITATNVSGRLTSLNHTSGASLTFGYNAAGRIVNVADSAGWATTYTYDAANEHLLTATNPDGTTTYSYSTGAGAAREHALASITEPGGITTTFEYDDRGRLVATQRAGDVERIEFEYGTAGKVTLSDASNAFVELFVEHRGLIVRGEDGLGAYTRLEFDNEFRPVRETNSLGQFRTFAWTASGALKTVTDEAGQVTSFAPSGLYNLPTSFTDARANTVRYAYDADGNLTSTTYPDQSIERISYDAIGNPTSVVNRRGQVIGLTYNATGQLTLETSPDGTTSYTYDARGMLKTATNAQGTTSFSYDSADRLTRVDYPNGRWLEYSYDAAGRRTRMEDNSGFAVNYSYDAAGRFHELRDASNALIVTYGYDDAGRLIREDKGNGTFTDYAYDDVGRVESIVHHAPGGAENARFDYTYDTLGRRVGMSTLDGDWAYTYDLTGQLTRAVFTSTNVLIANQDLNYEYDAAGNRVRTVLNGATTNYATNSLNQYTTAGTTTYVYDLDGNLIEETGPGGTRSYAYDSLNRLVEVVTPAGTWQYEYDALANRVAVVVDGVRSEYLLDPTDMGNVVSEYDGLGQRVVSYAHGLGLEGMSGIAGWRYYDFDALGSTAGVSGDSGGFANQYVFDPFGSSIFRTETVTNPFEFVGMFGVTTETNGLQYMRARMYAPGFGRFTSLDPISLAGSDFNLYRYGGNDPVSFADPSGLLSYHPRGWEHFGWGDAIGVDENVSDKVENGTWNWLGHSWLQNMGAIHDWLLSRYNNSTKGEGTWNDGKRISLLIHLQLFVGCALGGGLRGVLSDVLMNLHKIRLPFDLPVPPLAVTAGVLGGIATASALIGIASDPNEKFGATGVGSAHYIPADAVIPYRINFENLGAGSMPTPARPATVPAQRVEITDQLSSLLDWSTLEFTEAGFGDNLVQVPDGRQYHFATVPLTFNGQIFDVEVELSVNSTTGLVRAVFQSIDPKTSLPPDVLVGLLPPEDGSGRGKGHIAFTIQPKSALTTGTEIRNVAHIRFDRLDIIATNQVDPHDPSAGTDPNKEALNTIDADAPVATVSRLPAFGIKPSFTVYWDGYDTAGAGYASTDVFVSIDGAPYEIWQNNNSNWFATYIGQRGHRYDFVAVGRDLVGNEQPLPTESQASIVIPNVPTAVDDAFVVSPGKSRVGAVLGNDINPIPKRRLSAELVDAPTQGALTLLASGKFIYKSNVNSNGRDFFTYKIRDNTGAESNTARVELVTHLTGFTLTTINVAEGRGTATLTVALNSPATEPITIGYVVGAQSARGRGQDFSLADGTVDFAIGERIKTIIVPLVNDVLDENPETLQVWLTSAVGPAAIGKNRVATIRIVDNDATPKVSFRGRTSSGAEDQSQFLEVYLSAPSGRPVTVRLVLTGSTAKTPDDFSIAPKEITFAPGETSKFIDLAVVNDTIDERDEVVAVWLTRPVNATLGAVRTHVHTILSDDPLRTIAFDVANVTVSESDGTAVLIVRLSAPSPFPVTVSYAIDGATAVPGKDFVLRRGTLIFKPGETEKRITVRLINDTLDEPTESVQVRLSNAKNATLGLIDILALSIDDDDPV